MNTARIGERPYSVVHVHGTHSKVVFVADLELREGAGHG